MLFRKTFRNALATLLGMALALATSAAHAVVNLDTGAGAITIAAETLPDNNTATGGGVTYHRITPGSADLRLTGRIGVAGADNRQIFIRFDFGNMAIVGGNIDASWATMPYTCPGGGCGGSLTSPTLALEAGGSAGVNTANPDNYVIFSVPDNAIFEASAVVTAAAHNRLGVTASGPGTVRMTTYLTLEDAILQQNNVRGGALGQPKAVVNVVRALVTRASPGIVTATVRSGFKQFSETGQNRLGTVTIGLRQFNRSVPPAAEALKHAVGGADVTTLAQVASVAATSRSTVTFSGDFSVGQFTSNTATAPGECRTVTATTDLLTTVRNNEPVEDVSVPAALGVNSFCVGVPAGNDDEIPVGRYYVAVDYRALQNTAVAPMDLDETLIGTIRRDGTRVNIPYLTTFDGYVQRVIFVNRNSVPVRYTFNFVEEEGVTTTPGTAATGVVPADSKLVLRAADIVSIAGKTRTAATVDVVAQNGTVDVATTQLNRDTAGTDTVVYDTTGT